MTLAPSLPIVWIAAFVTLAMGCGDDAASRDDAGQKRGDAAVGAGNDAGDGGEPAGDPLAPRAGDRLRLLGFQVGELLSGYEIYDSEREENCAFFATGEAGADTLHCVPTGFGELRYASADCSDERVLIRANDSSCSSSITSGAIVRAASASDCGAITLVVRRLGAEAIDATYYRRDYTTGDCVLDDIGTGTVYASETAELDTLVAAEVELVPTGEPDLLLEILVGSDGSRFPRDLRWADGEVCEPMRVGPDGDGLLPCVPRGALSSSQNTYVDAACGEPVFTGLVDPLCMEPEPEWSFGVEYVLDDGCQYVSALYTLGESLTSFFVGPPETCTAGTSFPEHWRSFAAGEVRPFDTLPLTGRDFLGSSRLRLEHVTTQQGAPIRAGAAFFDTELDRECYPRLFADGSTRCVPADFTNHDTWYADAACTVPAYVTFVGGCNPSVEQTRFRMTTEDASNGCGTIATEVARLALYAGDVYMDDGTGCAAATLDATQAAFIDDALIAPEELAEVTVVGP